MGGKKPFRAQVSITVSVFCFHIMPWAYTMSHWYRVQNNTVRERDKVVFNVSPSPLLCQCAGKIGLHYQTYTWGSVHMQMIILEPDVSQRTWSEIRKEDIPTCPTSKNDGC